MSDNVLSFPRRIPPRMGGLYKDVMHTINAMQPATESEVAHALGANTSLVSTVIDCLVSDGFANKGGSAA